MAEWIAANKRNSFYIRTFQNTICSEPYKVEEAPTVLADDLYKCREVYSTYGRETIQHERCGLITGSVDAQQSRLELEICGHGENGETWGLLYHTERTRACRTTSVCS
jgi:hypothetical protein